MYTAHDQRDVTSNLARLTAGILFVLFVGIGYAVPARVESGVALPIQGDEQNTAEPPHVVSGCVVDGLVFAGCSPEL